jgi:CheY-like chemotaxis protein
MNRTILSVEDDDNDRLFLKLALEDVGLAGELRVVTNGEQAIDYLTGRGKYKNRRDYPLPCMVLLDLNLPFVSGFEILAWMRSQPKFQSTIVIPLSSSGLPEDIARARKHGVADYFVKPATLEDWRRIGLKLAERWFDKTLPQRMPFVRAVSAAVPANVPIYKAEAS